MLIVIVEGLYWNSRYLEERYTTPEVSRHVNDSWRRDYIRFPRHLVNRLAASVW